MPAVKLRVGVDHPFPPPSSTFFSHPFLFPPPPFFSFPLPCCLSWLLSVWSFNGLPLLTSPETALSLSPPSLFPFSFSFLTSTATSSSCRPSSVFPVSLFRVIYLA
ncbi:hypothetical protein ES332_A05G299500v1 [Gossypium tomentosum]|uniref:Uncharacterized protein n=1 Tax=Gossypium tomentosum TaxID=34277 RepID=A0A5D2QL02_GOSTO|nr:hypothetical protein ES332_A05G299500v1 [Gossypium tomentosum]